MVTDKSLLKWYMKGFHNELWDNLTETSENEQENVAYRFGATDAIIGDDVSSSDYQTDEQILKRIKNA